MYRAISCITFLILLSFSSNSETQGGISENFIPTNTKLTTKYSINASHSLIISLFNSSIAKTIQFKREIQKQEQ